MAWTTPRTWVVGEVVTAALMNAHVRDNENFLFSPPGASVYKNGSAQQVADVTEVAVSFDAEDFDPDGFHDNATNNTRLTVPSGMGGRYDINCSLEYATDPDGRRSTILRENGTTKFGIAQIQAATGGPTRVHAQRKWILSAGDYIESVAFHAAGNALDVNNQQQGTYLGLQRVGAE